MDAQMERACWLAVKKDKILNHNETCWRRAGKTPVIVDIDAFGFAELLRNQL